MDKKLREPESAFKQKFQKLILGPTTADPEDDRDPVAARLEEQKNLYVRFSFNPKPFNPRLPIFEHRNSLLNHIRGSPVVVIQGDTGCGKSTQVPQFILDDAYTRGEYCNIVVTQPRRIGAITLSERVCKERGYGKNSLVGYQVGLDRKVNEDTRVTFCTTGVLLEQLINRKRMDMYTHIILDEIHERDEEMEFVLIATKRFLIENPFQTKIILMSATIDTRKFAEYFRLPTPRGDMLDVPTICLTGERPHSIKTYYLEDLDKNMNYMNYEKPGIDPKMYQLASTIISAFSKPHQIEKGICFLVFLPGIHEIAEMHRGLESERERYIRDSDQEAPVWNILPLHSIIPSMEQRKVFLSSKNEVKIILATNIAESSVTVPDVKVIIDFCLTRTMEVEEETGFSMLCLKWASKNSCAQRAGRTGRTCDGRCYRLVSKYFYEDQMPLNDTPALLRCSLKKAVLKAKKFDNDVSPSKIIGLALDPPDLTDINYTIKELKEAHGLHLKSSGKYVADDGDLTFMGRIMESLPLDIRATRLIVMGYMFDLLEECIIMAAGLTVQKVFALNFQEPLKTYIKKMTFADGSGSDLFAILHAYQYMIQKVYTKMNSTSEEDILGAATRVCLDLKGVYDMYQLVEEIRERLLPYKLKRNADVNRIGLSVPHKNLILKVCIAGAFYPNYFLRASCISSEEQERQIYHDLDGRDPTNTIYYRGIGQDDMGILYEDQVKNFLKGKNVIKSKEDVVVSFDNGSKKMYVTFVEKEDVIGAKYFNDSLPGKVKTQVYKALKLNKERQMMRLKLLGDAVIRERYRPRENTIPICYAEWLCCIPRLHEKKITGLISYVQSPNKFWIRPHNEALIAIEKCLLETPLLSLHNLDGIIGQKVAVEIEERTYRAHVESAVEGDRTKFKVFLIDEGRVETVVTSQLKSLTNITVNGLELGLDRDIDMPLVAIPPRAIEATLTEVRPSYLASSAGKWTVEAITRFTNLVEDHLDSIEIYSFWNGGASVILHTKNGKTINEDLIERQLAEACEESYPSKYDHALRYQTRNQCDDTYTAITEYLKEFYREPIKAPPEELCSRTLVLRGPFSPLETTIYATLRSLQQKSLDIERFSINNVLLDSDSNDPTDRLLVAASCGTSNTGNSIILRNTTVMPNIRGFAALMAMLFAPTVHVNTDPNKSRFISLLCGLGYNRKKKRGYFEEHDVIIDLDCALDQEDLLQINKIRYTMSAFLFTNKGEDYPNLPSRVLNDRHKSLIIDLLNYLEKPRQLMDIQSHSIIDHEWGSEVAQDLFEVSGADVYGEQAAFPAFPFPGLNGETEREISVLRQNNEDLHQIAFCYKGMGTEVKCRLCSTILTSVPEVQIHLFKKLHKDRLAHITKDT